MNYKHIGEVILELRKERGIGGEAISSSIGRSKSYVYLIESGKSRSNKHDIMKIMKGLGLSTKKVNQYLVQFGYKSPVEKTAKPAKTTVKYTEKSAVDNGIITEAKLVEKCKKDAQEYMKKYIEPIRELPEMTQMFLADLLKG